MSDKFSNAVLEKVVAEICQTVGYSTTHVSSLAVLTSILSEYIKTICRGAHRYSELAGRTEPTLYDLNMVFNDLSINIEEVREYVCQVGVIRTPFKVPKYPVKKEDHFNFLRPGSNEVILRPLHIHEYLPPQFPELENKPFGSVFSSVTERAQELFPGSTLSVNLNFKCLVNESSNIPKKAPIATEGRPLREIKSILMTRSGFMSSSCEGKLAEVMLRGDTTNICKGNDLISYNLQALLSAKGLSKKGKQQTDCTTYERYPFKLKFTDSDSIQSAPPQQSEKRGKLIRKKMLQNLKTIKSGSQVIDRHLKHICTFKKSL